MSLKLFDFTQLIGFLALKFIVIVYHKTRFDFPQCLIHNDVFTDLQFKKNKKIKMYVHECRKNIGIL